MKIRLPIRPGDLAINKKTVPQFNRAGEPTGRLISSSTYRDALDHATIVVRQACRKNRWRTSKRQCRVSIIAHWPTTKGDRDSVCKAVCDALQHGGAVVNDKQCGPITLDATWKSKDPGVDVEIIEVME